MIPLLPFAAGLIAGGLAVRLWRSEETQAGVKKAQDTLRSAAQSGLDTLRETGAAVRQRFAGGEAPIAAAEVTAAAPKKKAAPRKRKPATAKAVAKAAAPAAPRKRARKATPETPA